jgi:NADP-dependent 3-hydroxy acid dehydrogenase YdfG
MAFTTAKLFVEESVSVFITGRSQEKLDKAIKEIGKNVTGVQVLMTIKVIAIASHGFLTFAKDKVVLPN